MDAEMRKKLEEAAKGYADENYEVDYSAGTTPYSVGLDEGAHDGAEDGFLAGAEHGYKEAIAQAKEWIQKNVPIIYTEEGDYVRYKNVPLTIYLANFEADMNKLWEDKGNA